MAGHAAALFKVDLLKLFDLLEQKSSWERCYFSIQNDYPDLSASVGRHRHNMFRNRYCNVWPWDHTRVVLSGDAHYINASHITAPRINQRYIATQEPLSGDFDPTKDEFWRMIWEQNCSVIIMLNDPLENNCYKSPKHYPYFPTALEEYHQYCGRGVKVTLVSTEDRDVYQYSKLNLQCEGEEDPRVVHHLQFKGWGDYGVPDLAAADFHKFIKESRDLFTQFPAPPVVHCSAGVGRTGTFILADVVLQIVEQRRSVNVDLRSVLENLRRQRMWLVQTPEQLRFCVITILEGIRDMDRSSFSSVRVTV